MCGIQMGRSADGTPVAEIEAAELRDPIADVLAEARRLGAGLVWAHGGDLAAEGFAAAHGYARLHADRPGAGEPLPPVEPAAFGPLLAEAFRGMWGHKHVDPRRPLPDDGSVVIALREDDQYVGLCRFWPDDRLVDQPGVVVGRRTPERKARLLAAACHHLGEGPVDLDTWGEDADSLAAYAELGFTITHQDAGWELRL